MKKANDENGADCVFTVLLFENNNLPIINARQLYHYCYCYYYIATS